MPKVPDNYDTLVAALKKSYNEQRVINSFLRLSLEDIPLHELLQRTLDILTGISWIALESKGSIFLVEDHPEVLVMRAHKGLAGPIQAACARVPFGRCICGLAAATRQIEFAADLDERHVIQYEGMTPHGHYCIPILFDDRVLGVIGLYVKKGHRHSQKEEEFLNAIANTHAGIIIRREAEESRRRSEEKFRLLYDNGPLGYQSLDEDGFIREVNQTWLDLMGYAREEVIGRWFGEFLLPEYCELFRERFTSFKDTGEIRNLEFEMLRKDGVHLTVAFTGQVAYDNQGRFLLTHCMFQDITERKQLESQFLQAQKMEAVGRLAGGVAHDFNNMLGAIMGYAEMMMMRLREDDPLHRHAVGIKKAADRAALLTRQLLAFSRKQVVQPQVLNLNTVVSDIDKMLRRLIGEDVDLVMNLDPALGAVKADPGQIEQILMNLAINAQDAMLQGGKLTIETANVCLDEAYIKQHHYVAPGPYVMLAVSDNGLGMDAETQAHIFEPFFTTKEQGKGTGLGLSSVYGIVRQSSGSIEVYSEPGVETKFMIYLPRLEAGVTPAGAEAPLTAGLQGTETILVVEDEDLLRELVCASLKMYGYKVLEASDDRKALLLSEQHQGPIHLMLTDVVMPQMSGRELAEHLAPLRPEMKVLYMSGYTEDAIIQHGVLSASAMLIQKPFSPIVLAGKIRTLLDASRGVDA